MNYSGKCKRSNYISESPLPLSPHKQSLPHNLDTTQVSFGTQELCAPLGGSFSQTVGIVGKARWQTDNLPNDSGRKAIHRNNAFNLILQQDSSGAHLTISSFPPEEDVILHLTSNTFLYAKTRTNIVNPPSIPHYSFDSSLFDSHVNRLDRPHCRVSSMAPRTPNPVIQGFVIHKVLGKNRRENDLWIVMVTSYRLFTAVSAFISAECATDMKQSLGEGQYFSPISLNEGKGNSHHHHY